MAIRLDHTIIPARDGEAAARWFADIFGRGVYFANPDDHLLEIITVPYGGVGKPG